MANDLLETPPRHPSFPRPYDRWDEPYSATSRDPVGRFEPKPIHEIDKGSYRSVLSCSLLRKPH